jgi:hypothetical protein
VPFSGWMAEEPVREMLSPFGLPFFCWVAKVQPANKRVWVSPGGCLRGDLSVSTTGHRASVRPRIPTSYKGCTPRPPPRGDSRGFSGILGDCRVLSVIEWC